MLVSRSFGATLFLASCALAACGGGGGGDKPVDAATPDSSSDAGCATPKYTAEIIDWNANATVFCGVNVATAIVRGQASITDTTNPNGRFELCLAASTNPITIDITPPTAASECKSTIGKYTVPAVLTLQPAVISKPTLASVRLLSDSELADEYSGAGNGQMFQPERGQLVIHIDGTPSRVATLTGIDPMSCGPARQFNGTAWENVIGSTTAGTDVLYPDCMLMQVGGQMVATVTTVALADGRSAMLTVEPNKFTYVTIPAP
ncbi:MAG TPA: hypothetical protein VGC42_28495 [Kofleriaceae bacterium]